MGPLEGRLASELKRWRERVRLPGNPRDPDHQAIRSRCRVPGRWGASGCSSCLTVGFAALPTAAAGQPPPPCPGDSRAAAACISATATSRLTSTSTSATSRPGSTSRSFTRSRASCGVPIEIRLLPWAEARQARERGTGDLFSAGYVPARDDQFDFLVATTTIRSSMLMRPGSRHAIRPTPAR